MVYIHLLEKSIFLTEEEKLAIINEELGDYLNRLKSNQVFEIAEIEEPLSGGEE